MFQKKTIRICIVCTSVFEKRFNSVVIWQSYHSELLSSI